MATLAELKNRLAKLEATAVSSFVSFTMPDRSIRKLKAKQVLAICTEALYGSKSPDVETLLTSVGNTASHNLVTLVRMCID